MSRLIALSLLLLPAPVFGQSPAKYADVIAALEQLIERERLDAGMPGLSVAIVEDQTIIWAKGFGHANLARTRPATPDTVYRVGSVSQLFTDIAVLQLVEEGKIELDAPVTKYLADFKPANPSSKPITLRQLMAHRSGLVREPPDGSYFDAEQPSLEKTIASLNGRPVVYQPGTTTKYSNAGIAVVGLVVEKVDGRPYAKAIRERVVAPLEMTSSDFEPTAAVKAKLAEGLMWTYHGREFVAPTFELGESPAGSMYSTATDLARLLSALFARGKGSKGPILKPETLREMLTPQFEKREVSERFGLGIAIGKLNHAERIGHAGAIYGFSTELAFLSAEKVGVVVIANKGGTNPATRRIADLALRHFLAGRPGWPMPSSSDPPKPASRDLARKLAGKYGPAPSHELIEMNGGLYYLPPAGGLLVEVQQAGKEFVLGGSAGSGDRLTCDGTTLKIKGSLPITAYWARQLEGPPAEPNRLVRGVIGEYGPDHNVLTILEKDGQLYALIEWLFLYPLEYETSDSYKFPADAGLYHGERIVFKRDDTGKAITLRAGGVLFRRRVVDGEDGKTFRIKPQRPVEELRKEAAAAKPPEEKGDFRKADLVELTSLDATIKTELRYASDNNFMGTPLYPPTARAYMQRPAAEAVARVNKSLAERGYGLWVFDAYRPWAVTKVFWEATPEKMRMFVADPSKGSRHNRGCAVDLTLYELKSGKPVEMVSGFDEFSDRAYPNYWGGTSRQRWHRELLRHAMEDEGFTVYEAEWWHFDYKDWKSYEIGNQSFEELGQRRKDAKKDKE